MDHWDYPGRALPGNRSIHHEPIHGQEPLDDIRNLLFDHAIYRRHLRAHHGGFIDRFGYATMFTFSAWAVTAVAVVTAIFIWDAKD